MSGPTNNHRSSRGELMLAIAVGLMLTLLILPLPPQLLDVLLAANLTFTLLVLFTVLATPAPRSFTSFPSLLLFLTLYRLGLNVASSRLILLKGDAGQVIDAFGNFVAGGNLVVGVIVFSILLVVQFVVITKGAGRISEVAARFTLDGLPGKQMAIDADLNAGIIDGEEAKTRRDELMKESEFYGAMDGASKFVRGDAVAGLIITVVNLLGGGILGLLQGMELSEAAKTYSILTIGDGLVAQVPALVVSIAGALLVTKSSADQPLPEELRQQLFSQSKTFNLVAAAGLVLALMPGLPGLPFLLLAGSIVSLGRLARRQERKQDEQPQPVAPKRTEADDIEALLQVDRLLVEVGYRLISLVQGGPGGGLLDRITALRKRFAGELGLVLPPIRVRDSATLDPRGYRIVIGGEEVTTGSLSPGCVLAMPPGENAEPVQGVLTRDPTFGLPAYWVREELREDAESKGYTVVETSSVLATHLSETLREFAHEVLTRDDTQQRVDQLKQSSPALVEEVTPARLSLGDVHRVLKNLLRENQSIRNLSPVFETLADHSAHTKDPDVLTEFVRERMARTISAACVDAEGTLVAITLDPALEQRLSELASDPNGLGHTLRRVAERVREQAKSALGLGKNPVVVVRPTLRRVLALTLLDEKPRVTVLSYNEVVGVKNIEPVSVVSLHEQVEEVVA